MRCLYCGKQLAFYRRLAGRGEFCSDAHRRSYQDEYNRLALSRLLQNPNAGEEPQAAPLPPATYRLQRRAGSFLDLDGPPAPANGPANLPAAPRNESPDRAALNEEPPRRVGFAPL